MERYWIIRPMRELIMDHGSEFGAHRVNEKGEWIVISRNIFSNMESSQSWQG